MMLKFSNKTQIKITFSDIHNLKAIRPNYIFIGALPTNLVRSPEKQKACEKWGNVMAVVDILSCG